MAKFIADFHIHSRYSRACSKDLTVAEMAKWAKIKGIGVLGTGDFTHPLWLQELKETLRETGRGLFEHAGVQFMLTAEVNTLFYKEARAHQIHHVLMAPGVEAVERINQELEPFGSLTFDGRPTLRMEPWRLVEVVLGIEPRCLVVPAHAWTPWFAIFGSSSGFDSVEECFEHQAKHIVALETGLSSDPAMNWRLSALDRYALISNSDSHCLHPDTRIYTASGRPTPISQLSSREVLSVDLKEDLRHHRTYSSAIHKIASPPILMKVSTRTKNITCTPEHRFFVLSGEEIVERKARTLQIGDLVATLRQATHNGQPPCLPVVKVEHRLRVTPEGVHRLVERRCQRGLRQKDLGALVGVAEDVVGIFERGKVQLCRERFIERTCSVLGLNVQHFVRRYVSAKYPCERIPKRSSQPIAQVLGYALGDGGNKHSEGRLSGFCLADKDRELLSTYQVLIKRVLRVDAVLKKRKGMRSFSVLYPRFVAEYFQQFSEEIVARSPHRRVPELIFQFPQRHVAAFLRGLYDAEGTVGHHWVGLNSSSQLLIDDVRALLLRFAIPAYVYPNFERHKKKWRYQLAIYGQEAMRRFEEHIGFSSSTKRAKLRARLLSTRQEPKACFVDPLPLPHTIRRVAEGLEVKVSHLTKKLQYHWYNGHALKRNTVQEFVNIFAKRNSKGEPTRSLLRKLATFSGSDILWEPIELVESVSSMCADVYDLTVPRYENYVANGFIVHNSARRIGREANVFDCEPDYDTIIGALKAKDRTKFLSTLEFFPEEGKYHFDGHRLCKVRWSPEETKRQNFRCPACGKKVTVGVMHRVETLADRPEGAMPDGAIPFKRLVQLDKIIADALGMGDGTQAVEREYQNLIYKCGTEFDVLLKATEDELRKATAAGKIVEGILRMREGRVTVEPGYDGEYGKVKIFSEASESIASGEQQLTLF